MNIQIVAFVTICLSGFSIGLFLGTRTGLHMAIDMIVTLTGAEFEEETEEEE